MVVEVQVVGWWAGGLVSREWAGGLVGLGGRWNHFAVRPDSSDSLLLLLLAAPWHRWRDT